MGLADRDYMKCPEAQKRTLRQNVYVPKPHWTTAGFPKRNVGLIFCCFAGIVQDVLGLITLGFYNPAVRLWVAKQASKRGWL